MGVFAQQDIGDFTSVEPSTQNTDFVIPETHTFQKIIEAGDPLTQGGNLKNRNDFTGYVPINGSSENGYLSINAEAVPGGVSILDINFNTTSKIWQTTFSKAVDFSGVAGTVANCSGTVTPWNTIISCEEYILTTDVNNDGYYDWGWCVEIDPVTKTVIDKRWALGNIQHENVVIHNNHRTVYQGADSNPGYLYKFVADVAQDLSSGALYVYKGSKSGSGNWILLDNTTPAERNSTLTQSANVGATIFNGIEDVEIGPDGWIYFAVKSEATVYRFQDSNPINGTTVPQMETFVGNTSYNITHANGVTSVPWGNGSDNLAFDGEGNLWVLQDLASSNNYIWVVENGHTQASPKVKIFGIPPLGAEPTGITFSPDYRFLFMSIQHPDGSNSSSTQTDAAGNSVAFNKGTSLVIARKEHLGVSYSTWYLDADNDGFAIEPTILSETSPGPGYTTNVLPTTDCDDSDALINPDTIWYLDADNDGFAAETTVTSCTNPGTGYTITVLPTTDCDDSDALINPDTIWYLDADNDGFATETTMTSCTNPGTGYTTTLLPTTDCDDSDALINPDTIWYLDADNDGFAAETTMTSCTNPGTGYTITVLPTTDCDDSDALINPDTIWYLDADNDGFATETTMTSCTNPGTGYTTTLLPTTDCDDSDALINPDTIWYLDADNDGFAAETTMTSCTNPGTGYTMTELPTTDCDDSDAQINSGTIWYLDADNDGFAVETTMTSCTNPGTGYTMTELPTTDCDDSDALINPDTIWYLDADNDGFAVETTMTSCTNLGTGYTMTELPTTDCDDENTLMNPNTIWYLDTDSDGYAEGDPVVSCESPGQDYTMEELPPELDLQGVKVVMFPNPTNGLFSIQFAEEFQQAKVTVVSATEQLVFEELFVNNQEINLDLSNQSSGVYYVHVNIDNSTAYTLQVVRK
ncbi:hypothetical protein FB2170_15703 [Maribacter sp. HTCC2170]|nr:hypothetical protein FB2170_15703 [Maribacter sp. HTCC2170]